MNSSMRLISFVTVMLAFWSAASNAEPPVMINGRMLSTQEVLVLEQQLGTRVVPGSYLYNAANGCWINTTNGTQGCLGQGVTNYYSRYGSGERTSDGSWSHYSGAAGGSVGGTSDGCLYTSFGWSNC